MVNTVYKGKFPCSERQLQMAKKARNNMTMVGRPSNNNYKKIIDINMIQNFQMTIEGTNIDKKIFGPDIGI